MYTGLGLSAIVFTLHGLFLYGWTVQDQRMALSWMIYMAILNFIGAIAYAARVSMTLL
jgi:adiponectin receptor